MATPPHHHARTATLALTLALIAGAPASADFSWGNSHVAQPLLDLLPSGSETAAAVQSGPWSDPATWGGALPGPGDDVLVPAGVSVTYDLLDPGGEAPLTRLRYLRVDGELRWATDRDTRLFVDTLFSSPSGRIAIGEPAEPLLAEFTAEIVIIADEPMDLARDPNQLGRGFIPHGETRIEGADKTDFAAVASDAPAGATTLTLRDAPNGWRPGDQLVLAGTYFDENGANDDNTRFHDEVLTVVSVSGNVVTFTANATGAGLRFDHARPDGAHFDPDDLNLYVANLTRNALLRSELDPGSPQAGAPPIVFPSADETPVDPAVRQRGHLMVMHNPNTIIRNAELRDFGRSFKDKLVDEPGTNLDGAPGAGANQRGRYALHLHRNLPRNNQPVDLTAATPAEIAGCVVQGSPGWGFVHHDSYAVFEDNVAFDIVGAAFVQEAGNEIGLWRNNLSIKTTGDDNPEMTVEPFGEGAGRVARFDFGFNGEAYWIQGASQVEFIDNAAASAAGGGVQLFSQVDGLGSQRDKPAVPREHLRAEIRHIVTSDNGLIDVSHTPAQTFSGLEVSNSDFGLITWGHMRNQGDWIGFTCPCDGIAHRARTRIDNFKLWNIYGQGVHMQYSSQIDLADGLVASSDLATPGVADRPAVSLGINGEGRGFGVGMNGPAKRLHISNVAIEGWRYGLRTPLEGQINDLDFGEGTGTEGAVGLPLRASTFDNLKMADNDHHLYRRQNGFTDTQGFPNWLRVLGGDFSPAPGNAPPMADFEIVETAAEGVVTLSARPSFDPDTPTGAPNAPNVVAVNDPNDIVAYAWDTNADGEPDHFGEYLTASFSTTTPVTLTVWDHQGLTNSITLDVHPEPAAAPEVVVDGALNTTDSQGGIYALTSAGASTGWFDARGTFTGAEARLAGQFNFSSIAQAVYNESRNRGPHTLTFDLESADNPDAPAGVSSVTARVFGVDGEFGSDHRAASPIPYSAIPAEITLLYEETFTGDIDRTTITRDLDLGPDGYQYLYVGFQGEGVSSAVADDFVLIDNVSLAGAPACAADLSADGAVDSADLGIILSAWGKPGATDLSGDGLTGSEDLAVLLAAWGPCP